MKRSHIAIGAFFLVMIVTVGYAAFDDYDSFVPEIVDTVDISENFKIGTVSNDDLEILDSIVITPNVEKKHYTINARDSPIIQN